MSAQYDFSTELASALAELKPYTDSLVSAFLQRPIMRPDEETLSFLGLLPEDIFAEAQSVPRAVSPAVAQWPGLEPLIGPSWEGHPFFGPALFWWQCPGEVDVTRMLATFCSEKYSGSRASMRRRSLLNALKRTLPANAMPGWTAETEVALAADMLVKAEESVRDDKGKEIGRIDVFFRSPSEAASGRDASGKDTSGKKGGNAVFCYAIEAKFDASLERNPFRAYNEYIAGQYLKEKAPEGVTHVVILGLRDERENYTPEGMRIDKNSQDGQNAHNLKGFHFVSWWKFLPAWEKEIFASEKGLEVDVNFSRFRMSIWSKIGGLDVVAQHRITA